MYVCVCVCVCARARALVVVDGVRLSVPVLDVRTSMSNFDYAYKYQI